MFLLYNNHLKTKAMKQRNKIFMLMGMVFFVFVSQQVHSQKHRLGNLRYQNETWNIWTIEANAGALSFFGDLSLYDNDLFKKIKFESGPGLSLNITKHFNRLLSTSGQLLAGHLTGSNYNSSFNADLVEYNLNLRINVFNLFYPNNKGKFGLTVFAGVGQFFFSSTKSTYDEGGNIITKHEARVPEFVYLVGGGGFLKTTDRFGISMDISLRQCQNDWWMFWLKTIILTIIHI